MFEANLLAILEAINELVHLELLTDAEFVANVNFSSLKNLASNELFFTTSVNYFYFNFNITAGVIWFLPLFNKYFIP